MKQNSRWGLGLITVMLPLLLTVSCTQKEPAIQDWHIASAKQTVTTHEFPGLSGPYLGQEPPGMTPEKFASGILSADDGDTINSVFSPDGKEFYYVFLEDQSPRYNLRFTKIEDGTWTRAVNTAPVLAIRGSLAALTHDGKYLLWSTREGIHWVDVRALEKLKLEEFG